MDAYVVERKKKTYVSSEVFKVNDVLTTAGNQERDHM